MYAKKVKEYFNRKNGGERMPCLLFAKSISKTKNRNSIFFIFTHGAKINHITSFLGSHMNVVTNINDLKPNKKIYLTVMGPNVERECVFEGVTTCASFEEFKKKFQPSVVHTHKQSCNELWKVDIEIGQKEYNYYTHYFPYWKNRPEFLTWRPYLTYDMTEYPYYAPIRCVVDINGELYGFGKDSHHIDANNINYIIRHQID